ncbi:MAG: DUF4407 domain-containing protein [Bacteroidota bacterium]
MNDNYSYLADEHPEDFESLGPFKRFFFTCAGAYMRILEVTPSEHNKYIGIGATIFLTACLAIISGSFAIYTILPIKIVAILFGLLWGALIFNLDRYIVSSMRKEGKLWYEIGLAMPRLILAVLISVVITKPIEVELFRNQINSELFAYTADLEKQAEMKLDEKLGLDSIRAEIAIIDSLRFEYKKIKEGKPTSFSFGEVSEEYEKTKKEYDQVIKKNTPRIQANDRLSTEIWEKYAVRVYDTVNGERVFKRWSLETQYRERRYRLAQINQTLRKEISRKQKEMDNLEVERGEELSSFREGIDEEIKVVNDRKAELAVLKVERDSLRKMELPQARAKAKKYGIGFPAKIEALERMKEDSPSIWWISNLIMLLFIMLETSPVFVKMIAKRGPYDYLLSRIEHQKKIRALQSISDMNYDLNKSMRKHNGNRLTSEIFAKEEY